MKSMMQSRSIPWEADANTAEENDQIQQQYT
jgi:hypothetical protein